MIKPFSIKRFNNVWTISGWFKEYQLLSDCLEDLEKLNQD